MRDVVVVVGPGQIGQAIARRVGVGKHVLLADMRPDNASAAAASLAINASGVVTASTTVLLTPAEVDEAVKKSVPYRAPGQ